jgi:DNA uptake protein ComE-like DNA-binding protein
LKIKKQIKDFLTFNKSERRGILVLSVLIVIIIVANILLPHFIKQKNYDYSQFEKEINKYLETQELISNKPKTYRQKESFNIYDSDRSAVEQKLSPFIFDPNTLNYEGWIKMGLNPGQAKSIIKFREKGGKFRKKEDLKKMYTISEKEYIVLEPFIEIKSESENKKYYVPECKPESTVDINTTKAEDLIKIKGIGNYFAEKIIKYRDKLGGYYSLLQLLEIPKMDSTKFNTIEPYLELGKKPIRKVNVNTASFNDLKDHPYIGYNIALSLVNYRTQHGKYKKLDDIKSSALINENNFEKISRYLCTE